MTIRIVAAVVAATALAYAATPALGQALPGTPIGNGFGTIDITDGYTLLPGPVVSGDLVMLENPAGGTDSSNWSNVVRFFSLPVSSTMTASVAYSMSDNENGLPT